jgi:CBS domain-containing protein
MDRPIRTIIEDQHPVTATADMTVAAASRLMKQKRIGAILVLENGRLAGIFTERDALFRVIAEGRSPEMTTLAEVMTENPRTIAPDRPFGHALHLMRVFRITSSRSTGTRHSSSSIARWRRRAARA